MKSAFDFVFLGLSITSSWGNGHATTYRGLIKELAARGHRILFLERNLEFYESNRDVRQPSYCRTELYSSVDELIGRFSRHIRRADMVVLGSYVPDGVVIGSWITKLRAGRGPTAFYDIDTPVTLRKLAAGDAEYLTKELASQFDLYMSFTGGPVLRWIEQRFGVRRAVPLYCSADAESYYPDPREKTWDLGYLGTFSDDRQPALERLLLTPAKELPENRFVVAGPQYPSSIAWPKNVERIEHLAPNDHREFYNAQGFTLNITRKEMAAWGYSPSVRLFEAAACGAVVVSDRWPGIQTFFTPGKEILLASSSSEVVTVLSALDDDDRIRIGRRARKRFLAEHTAAHRAETLESYVSQALRAYTSRPHPSSSPSLSPESPEGAREGSL